MTVESKSKAAGNCCDGVVVEVSGHELISTCSNGDEHHYTVARDATITCDGKPGRLSDLEEGKTIRMTMCEEDKNLVRAIDCGDHIPELTTN